MNHLFLSALALAPVVLASTAQAGVAISYTGATTGVTTNEGSTTQYVVGINLTSPSNSLSGWGATINWSDGATGSIGGGYTAYATRSWADEGVYSASLSGSGSGYYYGGVFTGNVYQNSTLSATLPTITVLNVAPTLTSLTSDLTVLPGQTFGFAAAATDPGASDVLSYSWDLDGDTAYDDATGTSGSWSYAGGVHTVGLQVSDGDGGFAFGSFIVTAPEPGALLAATGAAALVLGRRRRRVA